MIARTSNGHLKLSRIIEIPLIIPIPPFEAEGIIGTPLLPDERPRRILVIRLHAFGDAVITLPLLAALRHAYPEAEIAIVTEPSNRELFEAITDIDAVHTMIGSGSRKLDQLRSIALLAPELRGVDLLLDLQRSTASGLLRRLLSPRRWSAFDRYAPKSALDRYMDALHYAGVRDVEPRFHVALREGIERRVESLLGSFADRSHRLVCLNPAGCWPTKKWPIDRYITLGKRLQHEMGCKFVLIGTERMRDEAQEIADALAPDLLNLVEQTSTAEALGLMRHLSLMISDDSGLMHLAWVAGVPTIGIFGASRRQWSAPQGPLSRSFGSEDLDCGPCMSATCSRIDRHCLERLTIETVLSSINDL